jgi:hypothetical protein
MEEEPAAAGLNSDLEHLLGEAVRDPAVVA